MRLYNYICHLTRPLGIGSDDDGDPAAFNVDTPDWCPDSDGIGREPTDARPEGVLPGRVPLPHGTMIRRAAAKLSAAGISNIVAHTVPPHPDSELAQYVGMRCYADTPWPQKRIAHWAQCDVTKLNGGSEQVWDCDGSFEPAIQEIMADFNVVTSCPINAIAATLIQQGEIDHPILSKLPTLYPQIADSMDIWNDDILDVLELAHRSVYGEGRRVGGLWLTLGGGFLWGEMTSYARGEYYKLNTEAAKAAFPDKKLINCEWDYANASKITDRIAHLALALVLRLRDICKDFYFHIYFCNESLPNYLAAGMTGLAGKMCATLSTIEDCNFHLINSHAHDNSQAAAAYAMELAAQYPNIEFIAGVGWGWKLAENGPQMLDMGYTSIEVGLRGRNEWALLNDAVAKIRKTHEI